MREKWMKNLILKPYKEDEINKLRVCYKHFKESDYTGSDKLRRLIRACVPFMITTETCTETIAEDQNKEQNIQQQQEIITVLQENVTQLQTDIEIMFEKQEIVPQIQMKIENLSQQQEKQQKDLIRLQTNIEKLSQIQVQAQSNNQLQKLTQTVESLKAQLYQNSRARRPNLENITRKKDLSPTARKLYDNNIKLQAQKRRMKRIMNKMKQQNKLQKIILNGKKYKDQENRITKIREGFVNMILRNNDVLPQVSNP